MYRGLSRKGALFVSRKRRIVPCWGLELGLGCNTKPGSLMANVWGGGGVLATCERGPKFSDPRAPQWKGSMRVKGTDQRRFTFVWDVSSVTRFCSLREKTTLDS